jgi:succinate dehydrogenase/fumarate reductase flavoprotein subunit
MDENSSQKAENSRTRKYEPVSRRTFLTRTGGVGVMTAAAAAGVMATSAQAASVEEKEASSESKDAAVNQRVTTELPIPAPSEKPDKVSFKSEVLVVGGGFAGLNAAIAARGAGCSVVLVDKGRPGYSGLSPFASSHRWFDPEFQDDSKAFRDSIQKGGEYLVNMDWYDLWISDSKAAYLRLKEWGILAQFPNAVRSGGYDKRMDFPGYREKYGDQDRRTTFVKTLEEHKVEYVVRTMVTNVIKQDGKVVGAIGFDVPSGTVMTFHTKAVILCTGGGSYKPAGYPTGTDTFDGEYIGYQLGLPIVGKEFDDFHQSVSYAAGNAFLNNSWPYLENIWLCGGDVTSQNAEQNAVTKGKIIVQKRILSAVKGLANNDGKEIEDLSSSAPSPRKGGTASGNPLDPRKGKLTSPIPMGDIYGAAPGMCAHLSSGIFCGLDDLVGYTGLRGLYVAGDGTNGSVVTGAAYSNGVGFTSSFCSIQGWRAGSSAAAYAAKTSLTEISAENIEANTKEILGPMQLKQGLDPNWVRDVLQAIMAPYWVIIAKSETSLTAALMQVEYLREHVAPMMMASSPHDLRLCHEMRHKILSAEMKLRAGLERKESRGLHYRTDYPFRDDKNFLYYVAVSKAEDGTMKVQKQEIKDSWKGDLNMDYARRYGWRFPGETKAKRLPEEAESSRQQG